MNKRVPQPRTEQLPKTEKGWQAFLSNSRPPAAREWLSMGRGMVICREVSGLQTFQGRLRRTGDTNARRIHLGTFPACSVAQAFQRLEKARAEAREGKDPALAGRRRRGAVPEIQNLRALIETYLARREAEGRLRPSSLVGEQRQLSIFKNAMGDRLLSDIDARDISAMIEREAARLRKRGGPATNANRILGVVRRVFKKAIGWGLYQGPNPAAVVSRPVSEKPRERVLFDGQALRSREHPELNEIGPLLRSLRAEKGAVGGELETRVALEIALFMGMRASEICMLEWKNVRLDDAIPTLTIATGKTKNAARTLPLPAAIAARFNELKARGGKKARCVFPARADAERAEHLHAESLSRAFRRAAAALNIDGVTLHDLRRTVLSAIIELTGDESLAERIAGHGRRSTLSRHYDRSQRLEPMLAALTQWAETLEQVATARQ